MAEPINNETITLELELAPSSQLELSEDWIAYLNDTDVPSCVDGIDQSIRYDDDDNNTALA
jgi:hypothetical protein